jgi:hypothetical protein
MSETKKNEEEEEEEAYKVCTLIKYTNNAHKISLLSFVSLYRRLTYSHCMIVHIIDDNIKRTFSHIQV